jgi:hypothetical protein
MWIKTGASAREHLPPFLAVPRNLCALFLALLYIRTRMEKGEKYFEYKYLRYQHALHGCFFGSVAQEC